MSAIFPAGTWSTTAGMTIRVLIVDDSVVMRSIIERMFDARPDIRVAETVATAAQAFRFLAGEQVDIILLDHEMPTQKGLEALPRLLEMSKGASIIMLSSHCQRGSELAVKALSLGASDIIAKPSSGKSIPDFSDTLADHIRRLGRSRQQIMADETGIEYRRFPDNFELRCIGIGASTGGIHALGELLGGWHECLGVPILLTQHLPEAFIPYYAQQVERMTKMPVFIARSGQPLLKDHIYIAPGDRSIACECRGGQAFLTLKSEKDPVTNARPSVNLMLASLAECFGDGALGIILTGIGRDGTVGGEAIARAGGALIAQDRTSSVVWGMPGSITRAGLASANLRPEKMFDYIHGHIGSRP